MKKLKPSKEVLLQYLYDYGIKDTCKLLHITEEEFNSILEPSKSCLLYTSDAADE